MQAPATHPQAQPLAPRPGPWRLADDHHSVPRRILRRLRVRFPCKCCRPCERKRTNVWIHGQKKSVGCLKPRTGKLRSNRYVFDTSGEVRFPTRCVLANRIVRPRKQRMADAGRPEQYSAFVKTFPKAIHETAFTSSGCHFPRYLRQEDGQQRCGCCFFRQPFGWLHHPVHASPPSANVPPY